MKMPKWVAKLFFKDEQETDELISKSIEGLGIDKDCRAYSEGETLKAEEAVEVAFALQGRNQLVIPINDDPASDCVVRGKDSVSGEEKERYDNFIAQIMTASMINAMGEDFRDEL